MSTLTMRNAPDDKALPKEVLEEASRLLVDLQKDTPAARKRLLPVDDAADSRIRISSVDDDHSVVLFELSDEKSMHYAYIGTKLREEAIAEARTSTLVVDPRSGVTSVKFMAEVPAKTNTETPEPSAKPSVSDVTVAEVTLKNPSEGLAGFTAEQLQEELGITPEAFEAVRHLTTENDLNAALANSTSWESSALMALASGMDIEGVRSDLALDVDEEAASEQTTDTDAETIAGLLMDAAASEFHYVGSSSDAVRHIIEGGDFDKWRVFLHPSQQGLVDRDFTGPARVTGGAGTGKTVVIVHRATSLLKKARKRTGEVPSVFVTTFTRGLADSLRSQLMVLNPDSLEADYPGAKGVWTSNIDALAQSILKNATEEEIEGATFAIAGQKQTAAPLPLGDPEERLQWRDALSAVEVPPRGDAAHPEFLAQEYRNVVLAQQVTDLEQYLAVDRSGRGSALLPESRKKVWSVIEEFLQACRASGRFTFAAQSMMAAHILRSRVSDSGYMFDHVLVDEAQDFHAGHWSLLRAAVQEGTDDIFLAEDSHQRIYGQRLVLSRFGVNTSGRSRRLTMNYRTTRQNLAYASQMLQGEEWVDSEGEEDNLTGYRSVRTGPAPVIAECATFDEELDAVAETASRWVEDDESARIGILTLDDRRLINKIVTGLADRNVEAVRTRNAAKIAETSISVLTMQGAKGMEFTHVILVGISEDAIPNKRELAGLNDTDRADVILRARSLLYVAASRARDQLMITCTGRKSPILP